MILGIDANEKSNEFLSDLLIPKIAAAAAGEEESQSNPNLNSATSSSSTWRLDRDVTMMSVGGGDVGDVGGDFGGDSTGIINNSSSSSNGNSRKRVVLLTRIKNN